MKFLFQKVNSTKREKEKLVVKVIKGVEKIQIVTINRCCQHRPLTINTARSTHGYTVMGMV
jgi:hypothetical protein